MAKTPFELRADLLALATEILLEQHRANARSHYNKDDAMPRSAPTVDEVVVAAGQLNQFVQKKD